MVNCDNCGGKNRDRARFCAVCGSLLPSAAAPVGTLPRRMAQTEYATAIRAAQPQAANPAPARSFWKHYPLADGKVAACDPLREQQMPFDPGRFMVLLAFTLLALGACSIASVFGITVFIVLALLGGGLVCLLPLLLPAIGALLSPVMFWLRGKRAQPMLSLQIEDQPMRVPVNVIIYLKAGSSAPQPNSRMRVFGTLKRSTNTIRASRLEVYETYGQPANTTIQGIVPWPWWAGVLSLLAVVLLYIWALNDWGWIP